MARRSLRGDFHRARPRHVPRERAGERPAHLEWSWLRRDRGVRIRRRLRLSRESRLVVAGHRRVPATDRAFDGELPRRRAHRACSHPRRRGRVRRGRSVDAPRPDLRHRRPVAARAHARGCAMASGDADAATRPRAPSRAIARVDTGRRVAPSCGEPDHARRRLRAARRLDRRPRVDRRLRGDPLRGGRGAAHVHPGQAPGERDPGRGARDGVRRARAHARVGRPLAGSFVDRRSLEHPASAHAPGSARLCRAHSRRPLRL